MKLAEQFFWIFSLNIWIKYKISYWTGTFRNAEHVLLNVCCEPHTRPLWNGVSNKPDNSVSDSSSGVWDQLAQGRGELQNTLQKVKRELTTILEACLPHKNNSEILLLPPFLKKQLCTLTCLASWLLQNYFTAQFNSRVKTYFLLPWEKPKWDDLSGVPSTSQEPPTRATAFPWQDSARVLQVSWSCCQTCSTKRQLRRLLSSLKNTWAYDFHIFSMP